MEPKIQIGLLNLHCSGQIYTDLWIPGMMGFFLARGLIMAVSVHAEISPNRDQCGHTHHTNVGLRDDSTSPITRSL